MTSTGDSYSVTSGTTTYPHGSYRSHYLSVWCGTCGRKRGADGRCVNCDAWWTSPLIQVGGPLAGLTSLALFCLTSVLGHHSYTPAYAPVLSATATTLPPRQLSVTPPSPARIPFAPFRAPRFPVASVASASAAAPLPNLRNLTERADAAVAVSDAMRTMQPPIQRTVPVFAVVPRPSIPQPGGADLAPETGGQAPSDQGPDSPPPPSADAARLL